MLLSGKHMDLLLWAHCSLHCLTLQKQEMEACGMSQRVNCYRIFHLLPHYWILHPLPPPIYRQHTNNIPSLPSFCQCPMVHITTFCYHPILIRFLADLPQVASPWVNNELYYMRPYNAWPTITFNPDLWGKYVSYIMNGHIRGREE